MPTLFLTHPPDFLKNYYGEDVAAASQHGVLVTQASAGFIAATAELVVGIS